MKKLNLLVLFLILISVALNAQSDSVATDNIVNEEKVPQENSSASSKKKVSNIKIFGGVSTNKILLSDNEYESAYSAGYIVGLSYRQGKYGYWEIGLNYNGQVVGFEDVLYSQRTMEIRQLDFPVSVGINLLGETGRIVGLRLFGGLVPGYITGIKNNDFNISIEDFNQFQLAGHIGAGVDVLFLFVEGGYQYGFVDLLSSQSSNLSQLYFVLGFRF